MESLCFKSPLLSTGFFFGAQPLSLRLGVSSHGLFKAASVHRGLDVVVCRVDDRERQKSQRLGKTQEAARKREVVGKKREEALVRSRQVAVSDKKKNRGNEETVENLENLYSADFGGAMSVGVLPIREEEEMPIGSIRVKDLPEISKLSLLESRVSSDSLSDHGEGAVSETRSVSDSEAVHDKFMRVTLSIPEETLTGLDSSTDDEDDMEWVELGIDEDEEEEEEDENVELWEGDLPPMTPEEEEELLREAEKEIAELERAAAEGKNLVSGFTHSGNGIDLETEYSDSNLEEEEEGEEYNIILDRSEKEKKLAELKLLVQKMELELAAEEENTESSQTSTPVATERVENRKSKSEGSDFAKTKTSTDGNWEVLYEVPRAKTQVQWRMSEDDEEEEINERGIPAVMRCFDRAKIYAKAGNGGNGVVAFRREKFVPFGGPSGGNGGRGGHVYIEADSSMNSLLPFRNKVHFRAGRGAHGGGKSKDGAAGVDITIKVPPGTIIREPGPEGKTLLELLKPGQRQTLLPGGTGGRGNAAFKTGRNNAPQLAELGEEGTEM